MNTRIRDVMNILVFVFPINEEYTGPAKCISGTLSNVIASNTIRVDKFTVNLALISDPQIEESTVQIQKNLLNLFVYLDLQYLLIMIINQQATKKFPQ